MHSIAKEMDRAKDTIRRWSKKLGLSYDRSKTARASTAKHVDNKARRANLEECLLVKVSQLLAETDGGELVFSFGGSDNVYREHQLDRMTPRSKKDLIQAAGSALAAANRLHELNSEGRDLPAVDAWLSGMLGGKE